MWMLKNEAATFRPPVHMLGHQSPHQSQELMERTPFNVPLHASKITQLIVF